jgi:hypothetical protein
MSATLTQTAYDPGSILTLRASLKEYNLPVEKRATVQAQLEYPDHSPWRALLTETAWHFRDEHGREHAGIYRFNVIAKGSTYKGAVFTREQLLMVPSPRVRTFRLRASVRRTTRSCASFSNA